MGIDPERWKRIVDGFQTNPPEASAVGDLYALLTQMAGPRGPAEGQDLVSDVLVEILERPALVANIRTPDAYMRLLLRRRQFVRLRRAATERRVLQVIQRSSDPDFVDMRLEAAVEVAHFLDRFGDRLTPEEVELLNLRFWETSDLKSLAQILGISYGSAAVRVFRLLARIRLWLQEE